MKEEALRSHYVEEPFWKRCWTCRQTLLNESMWLQHVNNAQCTYNYPTDDVTYVK